MKPDQKYMPIRARNDINDIDEDNSIDFDNENNNEYDNDINLVPFTTQLPYNVLATGWIPVFIFENSANPSNISTTTSATIPTSPMGISNPFGPQFTMPYVSNLGGSTAGIPTFNYPNSTMGSIFPGQQFPNAYYPASNGSVSPMNNIGGTAGGMVGGTGPMGETDIFTNTMSGTDITMNGTVGFGTPMSGTGGFGSPMNGTGGFGSPMSGTGGFGTPMSGTGGFGSPMSGTGGSTMGPNGAGGPMGSSGTGGTIGSGGTSDTTQPTRPQFANFNENSASTTNFTSGNGPITTNAGTFISTDENLTEDLIPYNIQPASYSTPRLDYNITEILKNFDLDLDEELDLARTSSDKRIDNIFSTITKKHEEVISLLRAYNIPFPIIKLLIRRIIKLSLIHEKRADE